ncbi:MAG: class I SAM-dependent methyltransferase [Acidimicrobiales bacterium]
MLTPAGRELPERRGRELLERRGVQLGNYLNADTKRPLTDTPLSRELRAPPSASDGAPVGIGTGISALPFRKARWHVLGVEPDERMAGYAQRAGLEVEIATFEDWDPEGRTFDLVIAGQTWHWVDPVLGASRAAEVLRPGGRIALFWNVMTFPADIGERFSAVYRQVFPEFPFFQNGTPGGIDSYAPLLDKAKDGLRRTRSFDEPEPWQFDWERPYTREEWLEQVPTFGGHSQIRPEKLTELLAGIGEMIDSAGGSFIMGYTAVVVTARTSSAEEAS